MLDRKVYVLLFFVPTQDLPKVSGHIKGGRLDKENKANPLIVLVMLELLWIVGIVNTWMGNVSADLLVECLRYTVSGVNPTVGVYDRLIDSIGPQAIDWISHVLFRGYYYTERHQNYNRKRVV